MPSVQWELAARERLQVGRNDGGKKVGWPPGSSVVFCLTAAQNRMPVSYERLFPTLPGPRLWRGLASPLRFPKERRNHRQLKGLDASFDEVISCLAWRIHYARSDREREYRSG